MDFAFVVVAATNTHTHTHTHTYIYIYIYSWPIQTICITRHSEGCKPNIQSNSKKLSLPQAKKFVSWQGVVSFFFAMRKRFY